MLLLLLLLMLIVILMLFEHSFWADKGRDVIRCCYRYIPASVYLMLLLLLLLLLIAVLMVLEHSSWPDKGGDVIRCCYRCIPSLYVPDVSVVVVAADVAHLLQQMLLTCCSRCSSLSL